MTINNASKMFTAADMAMLNRVTEFIELAIDIAPSEGGTQLQAAIFDYLNKNLDWWPGCTFDEDGEYTDSDHEDDE